MTALTLSSVCERARPELACLGDLAGPLLEVVGVVEQVGTGRGIEALADPAFALDVLCAAGPAADPAVVGRVLSFLGTRTTGAPSTHTNGALTVRSAGGRPVTLADAAARYRSMALALMAPATQAGVWGLVGPAGRRARR